MCGILNLRCVSREGTSGYILMQLPFHHDLAGKVLYLYLDLSIAVVIRPLSFTAASVGVG